MYYYYNVLKVTLGISSLYFRLEKAENVIKTAATKHQ